jgi:hypothetical protein
MDPTVVYVCAAGFCCWGVACTGAVGNVEKPEAESPCADGAVSMMTKLEEAVAKKSRKAI